MSRYKKPIAYIQYPCYICEGSNYFGTAGQLLRHLSTVHLIDYPSRPQGQRRQIDMNYNYVSDPNQPFDTIQLGCPSCQFYTESIEELGDHMKETHESYNTTKLPYKQYVYRGEYYDKETSNGIMNKIYHLANTFKDHLAGTSNFPPEKVKPME
ncbi:hypothetical protein BD560DRAFT_238424 [Blakeslea trispora]|nr:hypothetical protein BD560DRAFT_238424 [Blakeslea trispora]